jgi:hypothetical protein
MKDPAGVVRIEGDIQNGVDASVVFTLPVGYRPLIQQYLPVLLSSGVAGGYVNVGTGGAVAVTRGAAGGAFLAHEFRTDQTTFPAGAALDAGRGFHAYRATDQVPAPGGFVTLIFSNTDWNDGGAFNPATGIFTPDRAGRWRLGLHVGGNTAVRLLATVHKNGAELRRLWDSFAAPGSQFDNFTGDTIVTANGTTDTFFFSVFATAATTILGGSNVFWASAAFIGNPS